jgi:hypothetical protein
MRVFREFGLNKTKMEGRVLEEFETICERIDNEISSGIKELNFEMYTDIATGSVINHVLTGFRFTTNVSSSFPHNPIKLQGNEGKFYKWKNITSEIMKRFRDPILQIALSSERMLKWPIFRPRFQKLIWYVRELLADLDDIIYAHEERMRIEGEPDEPNDFVDAYLMEQKKHERSGKPHLYS